MTLSHICWWLHYALLLSNPYVKFLFSLEPLLSGCASNVREISAGLSGAHSFKTFDVLPTDLRTLLKRPWIMKSVPKRRVLSRGLLRFDWFDLNLNISWRCHLTSWIYFAPIARWFGLHFLKCFLTCVLRCFFKSFRRCAEIDLSTPSGFGQWDWESELFLLGSRRWAPNVNESGLRLGDDILVILMEGRPSSFR